MPKTISFLALFALAAFAAGAQAASHGKSVYERTCVACHGPDGKGALPGVAPLGGKAGRLAKDDAVLLRSILQGSQTPGSALSMPAKGGDPSLTEDDATAVLQYLRKAFGR